VKKLLLGITGLFFVGIIVLLYLLLASASNPFNLSHWFIFAFSGFALSLSSFVVWNQIRFDKLIVAAALLTFLIIIGCVLFPDLLYFTAWNSALGVTVLIVGVAIYTLVPAIKSLFNSLTKVSIIAFTLILSACCFAKIESSIFYDWMFYFLAIISVLLITSVVLSKTTESVKR